MAQLHSYTIEFDAIPSLSFEHEDRIIIVRLFFTPRKLAVSRHQVCECLLHRSPLHPNEVLGGLQCTPPKKRALHDFIFWIQKATTTKSTHASPSEAEQVLAFFG